MTAVSEVLQAIQFLLSNFLFATVVDSLHLIRKNTNLKMKRLEIIPFG